LRIGHLIEHEQNAWGIDIFERDGGQGCGFEENPLMHSVRTEKAFEIPRPCWLRHEVSLGEERAKAVSGIFGGVNPQYGPLGIGKRCFHGMQAEEQDPIRAFLALGGAF
jgi:hypothetical protein